VVTLPLFPEPSRFGRERLAVKLRELASQQIYIGTSSWKYEGWCGQIYTRDRYATRSRFSQKRFEGECLGEYAETFPIVCGDFSFYQFPSDEFWRKLFHSAGPRLQFAFKVPEEITVREFPVHPRYGPRGGERNDTFLNADLFGTAFLLALEPFRSQVAVLIFEFGSFGKRAYENAAEFVRDLDPFLSALPPGWRYSVEIRNPEFLAPEYFACLREHGVAHVYNAWTRMPELDVQMAMEETVTAGFTVTRALLRHGRPYEEAVEMLSPYENILDENIRAREAIREQIRKSREERRASYIFVNNRLEGNAPLTIEAILNE
jgi:uncharacterized protein YecE (DUF72 family)